jgi:hypothetical protein
MQFRASGRFIGDQDNVFIVDFSAVLYPITNHLPRKRQRNSVRYRGITVLTPSDFDEHVRSTGHVIFQGIEKSESSPLVAPSEKIRISRPQ